MHYSFQNLNYIFKIGTNFTMWKPIWISIAPCACIVKHLKNLARDHTNYIILNFCWFWHALTFWKNMLVRQAKFGMQFNLLMINCWLFLNDQRSSCQRSVVIITTIRLNIPSVQVKRSSCFILPFEQSKDKNFSVMISTNNQVQCFWKIMIPFGRNRNKFFLRVEIQSPENFTTLLHSVENVKKILL